MLGRRVRGGHAAVGVAGLLLDLIGAAVGVLFDAVGLGVESIGLGVGRRLSGLGFQRIGARFALRLDGVGLTLGGLVGVTQSEIQTAHKPAVAVKRSVNPDYIVCLEDGKKLKMLKRYLRSNYNMTPEEYRAKWGLPADYPMVAPNYAAQRSEFAKKIGLGRTASSTAPQVSGREITDINCGK